MNLHSIRFTSVFSRISFSVKKYALFHPHFYMSILALSRLLDTDKNFVYERNERYFKMELYSFVKNFSRKTFVPYVSLVSADMDLQKCGEKSAYFFTEKQKRKKTDENQIMCKFTLTLTLATIIFFKQRYCTNCAFLIRICVIIVLESVQSWF